MTLYLHIGIAPLMAHDGFGTIYDRLVHFYDIMKILGARFRRKFKMTRTAAYQGQNFLDVRPRGPW